jgi:prevent-host-death family protein
MVAISVRELNQHTGKVLDEITASQQPAVITRNGLPGWRITPITDDTDDPVERLIQAGIVAAPDFSLPLPEKPHPIPSGRTVEELIADVSSDH